MVEKTQLTHKKLSTGFFTKKELIKDAVGNMFITRAGAARALSVSLPTLDNTLKRQGLRPLNRFIKGYKAYFFEDVEKFYNQREYL